ncbi:hypothetical protein [Mucilaginibacter sp. KACC 22063]|uniref:hypothetical protein n=1 Tax=Mucilaginibacter sp. KACC 22063 TaxID=3025666 RepID=UPI00236649DF|nr:hypothetical protein [Mucilaginibacter sp. KACC 22063]WDF54482.1 hypothetical protein PQ461_16210 [Mucilaginibacter sp. KACC 22063]
MNAYQQKWIDVLTQANVPGWKINARNETIEIKVPNDKDLKALADNLEIVLAEMSLDINLPKERLKFVLKNDRGEVDYILNPDNADLNTAKH